MSRSSSLMLGLVVVDVLEHDRAAPVHHQVRRGGRRLQHRALRREIAAQRRRCRPTASAPFQRGRMTSSFQLTTSLTSSQMLSPETVSASLCSRPASPTALHARPAGRRHRRTLPSGTCRTACRLTMVGTSRPQRSQSSSVRSMPTRPAIASRWMTALVEPPIAAVDADGVLEGLLGQDVGRLQVVLDHLRRSGGR